MDPLDDNRGLHRDQRLVIVMGDAKFGIPRRRPNRPVTIGIIKVVGSGNLNTLPQARYHCITELPQENEVLDFDKLEMSKTVGC